MSKTKLLFALVTLGAVASGVFVFNLFKYDFITVNGQKYKHSELQGQVLVVNYFAEWCAPCLREIPELNEYYHQAPEKVKLFAVSYDKLSQAQLLALKEKYQIEFPIISELKNPFVFEKPSYLPATFIVKPNGELAGQLLGEQTVKSLNEAVQVWAPATE